MKDDSAGILRTLMFNTMARDARRGYFNINKAIKQVNLLEESQYANDDNVSTMEAIKSMAERQAKKDDQINELIKEVKELRTSKAK
tara:strand:+ start:508 stop:765 length:258 start_codon:yes stop_codon:yes gene_type:complete